MSTHELRIVTFHLGYPTMVEDAETSIAYLLNHGWKVGAGGGATNARFVMLLRQVESSADGLKKGILQPAPPAPAARPASDRGTAPKGQAPSPASRRRRTASGQTYGPLDD